MVDLLFWDSNNGHHLLATMEFNLIVLNNNQISTFGAPLNIFVTLESAWDNALVAFTLVCGVPLEMDFFSNLE